MNLIPFSLSALRAHWKLISLAVLLILLAIQTWRVTSLKSQIALNAAKVEAAGAKVKVAAAKAELAATAADAIRRAKTKEEIDELRDIVEQAPVGNDAGPATSALLDRLRKADRR